MSLSDEASALGFSEFEELSSEEDSSDGKSEGARTSFPICPPGVLEITTVRKRKGSPSVEARPEDNGSSPASENKETPAKGGEAKKKKSRTPANKRRKAEDTPEDNGAKPASAGPRKTKKEQALEQFMLSTLPALRKNMKHAKALQSSFKIRDHPEYFAANSSFIPTFILPLFHFLSKEEIICTKVADFDGKKFVKTTAGFTHAAFISNQAVDLTEEDTQYLMKKYGKEWFKIPSKDFVKASSASKYGTKGEFKVTLIGLYEDSFKNDENEEIFTVNPILRYDPVIVKSKD